MQSTHIQQCVGKWLAISALFLCVPVAYYSICWMVGDIQAYSVRYALQVWEQNPQRLSSSWLDKELQRINNALRWSPENPEYHEIKARLQLYRAQLAAQQSHRSSHLKSAQVLHLEASRLRPRWPYSWANLALVQAYQGDFGADFADHLKQASHYGPWELSVNLAVLQAGLIGWEALSSEQQQLIVGAGMRGAEQSPRQTRAVIQQVGSATALCSQLPQIYRQQLCQ